MKLTHLLAGIVVAAGAIAGGVKLYVHHQVKSELDDLVRAVGPYADIRYADLDTDLSGSATVHGLWISPHSFPDEFRIDSVTLSGPDMDFLLNGFGGAQRRGKLPDNVALEIRGWEVRADSALVRTFREATVKLAEHLNVESDSCSLGQFFGAKDFAALGYDRFKLDMHMGYRFAETYPGIELSWEFDAGAESASLRMSLSEVGREVRITPASLPKLREASMTYRLDPDFTRKAVDYCAALRGVDSATYIEQTAADPDILYQVYLGFVPGPGLRAAFQEMLRNPGELVLAVHPGDPLDIGTLGLYDAAQLPDLLGLTASVNGRPVDDLSLSFIDLGKYLDKQAQEEFGRNDFLARLGVVPPRAATAPASRGDSRAAEPARYRTVEAAQLAEHVGSPVRILGSGGRKRNGVLLSVAGGIVTVETRHQGGTLTSTIALREIITAEAYH